MSCSFAVSRSVHVDGASVAAATRSTIPQPGFDAPRRQTAGSPSTAGTTRPARSSTLGTARPRGTDGKGRLSTAGPRCRKRLPAPSRGDRPLTHSITLVAQLARNRLHPSFLGSSTVSSLSWVGHPAARPSPWIHATGARSGQSHRSPLASRGNYLAARALRFAPARSSRFRMPCRERAVELAGGRGERARGGWACVLQRSRTAYETRPDSSQSSSSENRTRPVAARRAEHGAHGADLPATGTASSCPSATTRHLGSRVCPCLTPARPGRSRLRTGHD